VSSNDPDVTGVLRTLARADDRFARDAERLARLSRGGSPELPVEVRSASEIEIVAEGTPCPICRGGQRVDDHTAEVVGGRRLRVAWVHCHHCGHARAMFFRIGSPLPS
jgi:hypothetical protein